MTRPLAYAALALLAVACGAGPEAPPAAPAEASAPAPPGSTRSESAGLFAEVAASSGLDFVAWNGGTGRYYTAEINCGGGALVDADRDGDLDVYLAQGALLDPAAELADAVFPLRHPAPPTDRLYRNDSVPGDPTAPLRFTDVTATAGLATTTHYGCGVATGDVDGDGNVDLYLANFVGPDQLLRGLGDGTFEDVTAASGIDNRRAAVAASFFDYDRDGDLDVVAVNNMRFDYEDPIVCHDLAGRRDYCGPGTYPFEDDVLYRNRGDGTFEDVTAAAGLAGRPGPALGVITADLDDDGWDDIYVANDGQANFLWHNRGDGTFEERGMLSGAALDRAGAAQASMGVAAGDPDRDGDTDLLLTHLMKETNTLYRNQGGGLFVDASTESGLGAPSLPYTAFGTVFADLDLDGWEDLVVANGAVNLLPSLVEAGDPYPLHQPNQVFRNLGDGRFREATAEAGPGFALSEVSRGILDGDLDQDGDRDLVIVNNNGPVRLYRNTTAPAAGWIGVRVLASGEPPVDALGAEVTLLESGRPAQWRWIRTDGSYAAARDPRALFGLGPAATAPATVAVAVRFPDGREELWPELATGRYHALVRGTGTTP